MWQSCKSNIQQSARKIKIQLTDIDIVERALSNLNVTAYNYCKTTHVWATVVACSGVLKLVCLEG